MLALLEKRVGIRWSSPISNVEAVIYGLQRIPRAMETVDTGKTERHVTTTIV
jgi:hypothetical protein